MKKLMFAVAAIATGAVFADGITSANIVGYQDQSLPDATTEAPAYRMVTPTFANVGGATAIDISKFTVKGSEDGYTTIQVLNPDGTWDDSKMSYWFNDYYEGEELVAPAGWYDTFGAEAHEFTIEQGTAVFAAVAEAGVSFTSSGEVAGAYTRPLPDSGFEMVGNSTPVEQPITDFAITGSEDGYTSIQVLNADGTWDDSKMSYWFNDYYEGEELVAPAGWYDTFGAEAHEFNLLPGESVFFQTQETGLQVTIPAAIAE